MIRVTTNGTLYNYKSNLNQSTTQLNDAMMKLMTQRNFNTYASDPAAATRAFQIHSSFNAGNAQYDNNQTMISKFQTAWSSIQGILDGIDGLATTTGQAPVLSGLNATNESTLNTQGKIIRQGAEAIIQSLNAQYDGDYIFAGADSQNAPFAIETETINGVERHFVTYRGVRIDDPDTLGKLHPDQATYPGMTNKAVLDMWNEEKQYVDIGLGFELDGNGDVIDSTAFNGAISGLELIGYGLDGADGTTGDPTNVVSVMLRLSEIFEAHNDTTNEYNAAVGTKEDAQRLLDKFNTSTQAMRDQWVELDTEVSFLQTNKTQLDDRLAALNEERANLEDIDTADAILELSWAQVCYNAALQVGANVIPQSLMDYLN